MPTPNRSTGQPAKAQETFAKICFVEHHLQVATERSCWSLLMGNFKSHTALAAAVKLFDRVPSAKIPQTTNLRLFQRPFFAFLCRISSLPSYLSWTFVQFYTQTDCRDLHMRSKSGNIYATEIEKLPFIRCFAAKSISNSCWQVLVGHEHLTGWIISAKKKKKFGLRRSTVSLLWLRCSQIL